MLKECDLKMLQKIQNNSLKCVKPKQSLSDINRELCVLPVHKLIKLEQAKLGFKICNNMLPTRLSEALLTDHMSMSIKKQHKYNASKQIPNLPSAHSTQYRNSFLCKAISTYSDLPVKILQIKGLHNFTVECKKYLHTTD